MSLLIQRWSIFSLGRTAKRGEVGDLNKNEAFSQAQNIPKILVWKHIQSIEKEPALRDRDQRLGWTYIITLSYRCNHHSKCKH